VFKKGYFTKIGVRISNEHRVCDVLDSLIAAGNNNLNISVAFLQLLLRYLINLLLVKSREMK